ncbi:MAG: MerR family transcriptional regulator [Actinomycetia bacterium]|nr:MerR family transcriptional regulator [Actinomycetes bacterium]
MSADRLQIGEVAERVGLSLRTIRFYEEAGLVIPTARSEGGFRLYSGSEVKRLRLIKKMKPLGLSVEEIGKILAVLDSLATRGEVGADRPALLGELAEYRAIVDDRIEQLQARIAAAQELSDHLGATIDAG